MKNSALALLKQGPSANSMRHRFLAVAVDFVVIAFLCQISFALFGAPDWNGYLQTRELVRGLPASDPLVIARFKAYQDCFSLSLAIGAAAEALQLVLFGGTVGKLIFGLRVADTKSGSRASWPRLVLRAALKAFSVYLLSAMPFIFLGLTAFGNPERRSGFDFFAGTKVMRK
jgi:uncharacterized RDD family membrane protein YckC